jgi:hypothetical protein
MTWHYMTLFRCNPFLCQYCLIFVSFVFALVAGEAVLIHRYVHMCEPLQAIIILWHTNGRV